ncbi:MAG: peptidase M20 [Deltaproteobacteria bacterium]|nr:peptidase M20 [Deltaproteobacteria bacterium]
MAIREGFKWEAKRRLDGVERLWGFLFIVLILALGWPSTLSGSQRDSDAEVTFVDHWLTDHLVGVVDLYKKLHAQPELSLEETKTAGAVAGALRAAGFTVSEGIGGHGVVGVLENGSGPTVLIRGDMDALPVTEETGLSYASQVEVERPGGGRVGVMHACGHDVHTAALTATAGLMAAGKAFWSGTLVLIAQPAEEIGRGARAMIEAGLFERFPVPEYSLALHVESGLPAGTIGYTSGWTMANVDSVDLTFWGRGGHGARPHQAVDPIVTAAHFVTALQTLVSRRIPPQDPAVVTVGSFHAGAKHNVIPDQAHLQLTVRSYTDAVRKQLLDGIAQLARDTCRTFQCPRPPDIEVREGYTPAVYNDPALTERATGLFRVAFGAESVVSRSPSMGGEDFGRYSRELGIPGLLYRVGAQDPEKYEASRRPGGDPLPSLHSSRFAPVPELTLEAAVRSMSLLALDLLKPEVETP